jgi:signal transduction histidine kinase
VTIRGFLGFLQQDIEAGRADRTHEDVERIRNATEGMKRLLDELLELSRVGRQRSTFVEVDLAAVVHDAVEIVGGGIAERGVEIDVAQELPAVMGDTQRLREVFQNLIDNAVKFMGEATRPRIEIGARDEGEEVVCFVRDNGVGIDPRYHARVFDLFERLDPAVEGTGMGLAMVKRIVEVHGGRIWVESEGAGKGTTFWWTLPAARAGLGG